MRRSAFLHHLKSGRVRLGLGVGVIVAIYIFCSWLFSPRPTQPIGSYTQCAEAGYPISETDPPICSDGQRTYLGPSGPSTTPAAPISSVPFDLLVDADSQGYYPNKQELITNEADWVKYWSLVHADISPQPPILPVDFSNSNVLAISEGRQPTTGYNLDITGISASSVGTTVDVTETIPDPSCHPAATPSDRYFIVRTTGKLILPVSFRINPYKHPPC